MADSRKGGVSAEVRQQPLSARFAPLIFSIKAFGAMVASFYLANWVGLAKPYWAVITVYFTAQPFASATRARAVYRLGGTIVGACASLLILPSLSSSPELLSLAIAIWTAGCLYVSLLDRTPRSYAAMLAGYTAAFIIFPIVNDPGNVFDVAVARVQEITIGVVTTAVIMTLIFPRPVLPVLLPRLNAWFASGRANVRDSLDFSADPLALATGRAKLAVEANDIDLLSDQLAYESELSETCFRNLRLARARSLSLLPLLGQIRGDIEALGERDFGMDCRDAIDKVRDWVSAGACDRGKVDELRNWLSDHRPKPAEDASWTELLRLSLMLRLRKLVDLLDDWNTLQRSVGRNSATRIPSLRYRAEAVVEPRRHRNHGMAALSAFGVAIAMLACCAFWILSGWPDGTTAPMAAALLASFFATLDDPAPAIWRFAVVAIISIGISGVYLFGLMPLCARR